MPELPEVQTVINSIKNELINSKILKCELFWKNIIYNYNNNDFVQHIENKVINDIYRKGKYIIFKLNKGFMICHLRMTGTLFIVKEKKIKNIFKHALQLNLVQIFIYLLKILENLVGFTISKILEIYIKKLAPIHLIKHLLRPG